MRIKTYVLGPVSTNCYVVYEEESRRAVVIDPADRANDLAGECAELNLKPEAILLTHGHFDHVMGVKELKERLQIPVYALQDEKRVLADPELNASLSFMGQGVSICADHELKDQECLSLIGFSWEVLATPGHTAGSTCYYVKEESVLFSGDTLFAESYGRTDFPTGSAAQIVRSIQNRLFVLPDDTMVYPGHGDMTTIGHEKKYNPVAWNQR